MTTSSKIYIFWFGFDAPSAPPAAAAAAAASTASTAGAISSTLQLQTFQSKIESSKKSALKKNLLILLDAGKPNFQREYSRKVSI